MKSAKGFLSLLLALVMALSVASVSFAESAVTLTYAEDQTLRVVYSTEASSLSSLGGNGTAGDWKAISNVVEGLLGEDSYGHRTYALADSFTISEDQTVYTFHIREGLYWVDYTGKQVAELTAEDFVTSAKFICDPANASGNAYYYADTIKGAKEVLDTESGVTGFDENVGFKALDKYTLELTLVAPIPYFTDYCGSFIPVPTEFYNEMGEMYGTDAESTLYIGAYYVSDWEPQFQRVYTKNPYYFDADKVYIDKVVMTYNAEASTLAPEMFKRGEVDMADIGTDILDAWKQDDATKDIVLPALPDNTYMYYYSFCWNPDLDEATYETSNYLKALDNENFRQSLYWGLDRYKANLTKDPYNADLYLTKTITPETWCEVDGKDYTAFDELKGITERENYSFNEAKALEYKEAAVKELTEAGVTLPVKMVMPYNPVSNGWAEEVQVVKQQLEALLGTDYINLTIEAGPTSGFLSAVRRSAKYQFMKLNNGGSYADPTAWILAFQAGNNWTFLDQVTTPNVQALQKEYQAMLDEAATHTGKDEARYAAYAKAEAFLLEHALVIPFSTDTWGNTVGRVNPFEQVPDQSGRYKYMHVLSEPLTAEQFTTLYAEWKEACVTNAPEVQ